jgi:putative DNA primase/helicase
VNASLLDRLAAAGIHLQRARDGENRAACPRCNRPHHDDALAVRIAADRACWVCHRCGWAGATSERGDHQASAHRAPLKLPKAEHKEGLELARQIWIEAVPLEGTLGEAYLKRRACIVPRADGDVRFHPRLFCAKASRTLPALVCRVSTVAGNRGIGVHRIFLDPLGATRRSRRCGSAAATSRCAFGCSPTRTL